jgi:hypothetical protein
VLSNQPLFNRPLFNQPLFDRPVFDRPVFDRRQFHEPELGAANFVLERWLHEPSQSLASVLRDHSFLARQSSFALGDDGTLLVDQAPRRTLFPIAPGCKSWRVTARLLSGHRLVARLDIEIDIREPAALVQLRPIDRRPQRWSARHKRRYFALAHAGADRLEQLLKEHASVDVTGETACCDSGALTVAPTDPDGELVSCQ